MPSGSYIDFSDGGGFADWESTLMLVAARLRHVAGTKWGTRRYLDMNRLREQLLAEPVTTMTAAAGAALTRRTSSTSC